MQTTLLGKQKSTGAKKKKRAQQSKAKLRPEAETQRLQTDDQFINLLVCLYHFTFT